MTKLSTSKFLAIDNKGISILYGENRSFNLVDSTIISVRLTIEMLRLKKMSYCFELI